MKYVKLERSGHVGILTICRPEVLNALNTAVVEELSMAVDEAESEEDIWTVILTGEGRAFVAGGDISEMNQMSPAEAKQFSVMGNQVLLKIENMTKPVIAAVNGFALGGGCELAMCCDIRLASEKAKIGLPEVGLGIIPGFGGTQRMARIVGSSKAMELIFTARRITAEEAERIGLVSTVYPAEELMPEAVKLAETICSQGQMAVHQAKRCIRQGMQTDIYTGTAFEAEAFSLCFSDPERNNRMNAFLAK